MTALQALKHPSAAWTQRHNPLNHLLPLTLRKLALFLGLADVFAVAEVHHIPIC